MLETNCMYCGHPARLGDFAVKIGELACSIVYLHLDKTYRGRCIVALKEHKEDIIELKSDQLNQYMAEVVKVAGIIKKVFNADKINYAIFGDKVSHVHFHIVPKIVGGPQWGSSFQLVPDKFSAMGREEIEECVHKILTELEK